MILQNVSGKGYTNISFTINNVPEKMVAQISREKPWLLPFCVVTAASGGECLERQGENVAIVERTSE